MTVEISAEAWAQLLRIDAWWRANRPAAPDLFAQELDAALQRLADAPDSTVGYAPRPGVRRLLLGRTRYHLYVVRERSRICVVAAWSACRGRPPPL